MPVSVRYIILFWLLAVNFASFVIMGTDKHRAIKKRWRVQERTFFVLSVLGGSPGCIAGMLIFRHKTRHAKFVWGIPAIMVLQIVVCLSVYIICFR
ncbi:MAG: DUF1294 domain-containing protein [Clostridiales bacterium]|nr:DUF1294 domain-containing protein [Clostridiales bacterium]